MSTSKLPKGQLTLDYDKWIRQIVRRMWFKYSQYYEFEDLLSIATIASLEAEEGYDATKAKFSAYVKPRVEGAIIRALSNMSSKQQRTLNKIYKFIEKYVALNNRVPAQHVILKEVGLTQEQFKHILETTHKVIVVPLDDLSEGELIDSVDMDMLAEFDKVMVIVSRLPIKQQKLVERFLENPEEPSESLKEILGIIRSKLNIQENTCQIE